MEWVLKSSNILDHSKQTSIRKINFGDVWNNDFSSLVFTSLESMAHDFFSQYTCKCVSIDLLNNHISLMAAFFPMVYPVRVKVSHA